MPPPAAGRVRSNATGPPAADSGAAGFGGGARLGAFGDQLALELGQCPEHVQGHPPDGGGGVDALGQ
jgi:hypothetical protein